MSQKAFCSFFLLFLCMSNQPINPTRFNSSPSQLSPHQLNPCPSSPCQLSPIKSTLVSSTLVVQTPWFTSVIYVFCTTRIILTFLSWLYCSIHYRDRHITEGEMFFIVTLWTSRFYSNIYNNQSEHHLLYCLMAVKSRNQERRMLSKHFRCSASPSSTWTRCLC